MPFFQTLRLRRHHVFPLHCTLACGLALGGLGSAAAQQAPVAATPTLYVQAGMAREDARAWIVGTTLPWKHWSTAWAGGTVRGHWDLHLGQWSAKGTPGRTHSA